MEFLTDLWLPILVNAVVLFFASFIAWVILPHHFGDKKKLANEKEVMDFIRQQNIPPGNYMFPYCNNKQEQGSKDFQERYAAGPVGCLDVYGPVSMPMNMVKTVIFFLITSAVIAYITHYVCPPRSADVDFLKVFRVAGTIGILTHATSGVLNNIWFKRRSFTDIIDGVVFGIILGLIFAALWPYAN
jgi:hypothetical protein